MHFGSLLHRRIPVPFEGIRAAFRRLTEDRAISLEELSEELKKLEKRKILIGDGAELCYNTLRDRVEGLFLLPEPFALLPLHWA